MKPAAAEEDLGLWSFVSGCPPLWILQSTLQGIQKHIRQNNILHKNVTQMPVLKMCFQLFFKRSHRVGGA